MGFAAFLVAMVGPMVARMIAALGVSLVTISGLVATTALLKSTMVSQLASLPGDGLELAGLFGIWTCMGMVLGSITFVVTWRGTTGFIALAKA